MNGPERHQTERLQERPPTSSTISVPLNWGCICPVHSGSYEYCLSGTSSEAPLSGKLVAKVPCGKSRLHVHPEPLFQTRVPRYHRDVSLYQGPVSHMWLLD